MENFLGPTKRRLQDQVFVWDSRFAIRQTDAHNHESDRLAPADGASIITEFLNFFGSRLDPPQYNYNALRGFLEQGKAVTSFDPAATQATQAEYTVLLDDRRDPTGWQDINRDRHFARDWNSYAAGYPPEGENVTFTLLNARDLYEKQSKSVG